MSRSYKKTPAISETNVKGGKRLANKKVRRLLKRDLNIQLFSKSWYKRILDPWEVRDYREVAPSFEVFCERDFNHWMKWFGYGYGYPKRELRSEAELWELYQRWYKRK